MLIQRSISLALAAAFLCVCRPAQAEELERALELEESGQLVEALHTFELALRRLNNSRDELATIYLHLGVLQLAAGDRAAARQSMDRLLSVSPSPVLPSSAPPEAQEVLDEATSLWNGRQLHADVEVPASVGEGEGATIIVRVINDVAGIVDGVAVVDASGEAIGHGRGHRSPYVVELSPEAVEASHGAFAIRLLGEYGGVLWESEEINVSLEGGRQARVDDGGSSPPLTQRPGNRRRAFTVTGWTLLAVGLAAGGLGGALVGIDGVETGETQPDPNGILREEYATGAGGWALIGSGSAVLISAIVLLALRPRLSRTGSLGWHLASARGW